jgi:hypothetical protein
MEILILFVGLLALDAGAFLWGADSRDSVYSSEWSSRKEWRGFGGIKR